MEGWHGVCNVVLRHRVILGDRPRRAFQRLSSSEGSTGMFFDVTNLTQVSRRTAPARLRGRQRRTDFELDRWFATENQRRDSGGSAMRRKRQLCGPEYALGHTSSGGHGNML